MAERSAVLIFNPAAGRGPERGRPERIVATLAGAGWEVATRPTEAPGHATALARDAAAEGAAAVFALGGDGTLRETAAGLLGSATALAFLPAGTGNVMARVLGVPPRPLAAAGAFARTGSGAGGRYGPGLDTRELDVGLFDGEPFLMQASAGLDAVALAGTGSGLKRLIGRAAVVAAALRAWWSYRYPRYVVRAAGRDLEGTLVVAANIPFYGGPWKMAPAARTDDGRLEVVVFSGNGRAATLGLARDLLLGRHPRRADVESFPAAEVEVEAPPGAVFQLDGDALPASDERAVRRIRIARERLRVLVPAARRR